MKDRKLILRDLVRQASPDTLRVVHRNAAWCAKSDDITLMRPDGSTSFSDLCELLGVLAGVGIRCAQVEWDGLPASNEGGRRPLQLNDQHGPLRSPLASPATTPSSS
ncbi:hypothetical protein [Variovorax gossypii]